MGEELYLEPNRKAQVLVLIMFGLVAAVLALLEPTISRLTPSQNAPLEELEAGVRVLALLALGILVVGFISSLVGVAYFGRLGYRALKLGSYPPPGAIVVFRTRVQTGKQAVLAGWLTILCAILAGLLAVSWVYPAWLLRVAL
jgi:hypothetical protein